MLEGCGGFKCPSKSKILQPLAQRVPTRAFNSSKNPYLKKLKKRIKKEPLCAKVAFGTRVASDI